MGPGILIPAILAALFGGISLWKSKEAEDTIHESVQPGAQPGTTRPDQPVFGDTGQTGIDALDENPYGASIRDLINTGSQYSPTIRALPAQLAANQAALEGQQGYADINIYNAERSRLGELPAQIATLRSDTLEKIDAQSANSAAARGRAASTETARDALLKRVQGTETETGDYFRRVRDNPDIFSQSEIDAMATRFAESQHAQAGVTQSGIEDQAARQGLSPQAVAALKLQATTAEGSANDQYARDLIIANATDRAKRADQAAATLGGLMNALYGTEGTIGTTYTNLAEGQYGRGDAIDQWIAQTRGVLGNELFQTEANVSGMYDDRRNAAIMARAALEQPENLMVIGSLVDEIDRYNTQMEAGAKADAADTYAAIMSQMIAFTNSSLTRSIQEKALPSDWQRFMGAGGNALANFGANVETLDVANAMGWI